MIDKLKLVSLNDTLHEIVTSNATYKIGRAPDPVEFMEPDMNRKFLNDLNSSRPSDVVFCNLETSASLSVCGNQVFRRISKSRSTIYHQTYSSVETFH